MNGFDLRPDPREAALGRLRAALVSYYSPHTLASGPCDAYHRNHRIPRDCVDQHCHDVSSSLLRPQVIRHFIPSV